MNCFQVSVRLKLRREKYGVMHERLLIHEFPTRSNKNLVEHCDNSDVGIQLLYSVIRLAMLKSCRKIMRLWLIKFKKHCRIGRVAAKCIIGLPAL